MKSRKKSKLPKVPRSKQMIICSILILLPINFLLQIPVAMHISYGQGVLLTSLLATTLGVIDYFWTKKHYRGLFTQEQYKRYLKRQAAIWILVLVLILVVNWLVRLEY